MEETKITEIFEDEEVEEAPIPVDQKKRKAKAQIVTIPKKVAKPSQP